MRYSLLIKLTWRKITCLCSRSFSVDLSRQPSFRVPRLPVN